MSRTWESIRCWDASLLSCRLFSVQWLWWCQTMVSLEKYHYTPWASLNLAGMCVWCLTQDYFSKYIFSGPDLAPSWFLHQASYISNSSLAQKIDQWASPASVRETWQVSWRLDWKAGWKRRTMEWLDVLVVWSSREHLRLVGECVFCKPRENVSLMARMRRREEECWRSCNWFRTTAMKATTLPRFSSDPVTSTALASAAEVR